MMVGRMSYYRERLLDPGLELGLLMKVNKVNMMTKLRINVGGCVLAFLHSTQTLDALKVVLKETALLDEGGQSLSNGLTELIPGGESGIMADYFVQSVTVML